jgi:hypothetical protein
MRSKLLAVGVLAAITVAVHPLAAAAQAPDNQTPSIDNRALVVGLGAIGGVVAFNALALGLAALPGGLAYGGAATVPAEMSVAISRVYATTSAVIGGWVGYSYAEPPASKSTQRTMLDPRLVAAGAGAVMGAVTFNILAAPFGTVPLAGGALAPVAVDVALGSRMIAAVTAGAGALGANWLYDQWTGQQSDYKYLGSLAVGAVAGVAVGNLLSAGTVGVLPYYPRAGAANAAGALASGAAQAASRVYVIGSAVLGAWAADYVYRR